MHEGFGSLNISLIFIIICWVGWFVIFKFNLLVSVWLVLSFIWYIILFFYYLFIKPIGLWPTLNVLTKVHSLIIWFSGHTFYTHLVLCYKWDILTYRLSCARSVAGIYCYEDLSKVYKYVPYAMSLEKFFWHLCAGRLLSYNAYAPAFRDKER